jgi:hypothetical protein
MAKLRVEICAYIEGSQVLLCITENSCPFMGDAAPTIKTYDHYVWSLTHTEICNALPVVCKLKPAHNFPS